jgi:hypothetical protein
MLVLYNDRSTLLARYSTRPRQGTWWCRSSFYAVLIVSCKLCHYFQAHKVSVITSYLLRSILHNPDATGNFTKRVAELAEFDLEFAPHHNIKSQALANFVVEWTLCTTLPEDVVHHKKKDPKATFTDPLHFDGSTCS